MPVRATAAGEETRRETGRYRETTYRATMAVTEPRPEMSRRETTAHRHREMTEAVTETTMRLPLLPAPVSI